MVFKGQDLLLSSFFFLSLLFELITQYSNILLSDLFFRVNTLTSKLLVVT